VQACKESVAGIRTLTQDLEFPERFYEPDPIKTDDDFNVNSYMSVLNHLSIEPGYVLDFVYFGDDLGGKPLVYARQTDQTSYETYAEFLEAIGASYSGERSYGYLGHAHDFMEKIETDDTAEGYLQLITLATLVDQFYLYWHALYHDEIFLCDRSDLDKVVAEIESFDIEVPEELMAEAQSLSFTPTVLLEEDTATIRYIFFTKWGGFIESWYTVTRKYPHQVIDGGGDQLIEYDCGINF
jgi:hypothetical protein